MKEFTKTLLSLVAFTAAAGAVYVIVKALGRGEIKVPAEAVRHKETLTLADIVNYFKGLNLNEKTDTPVLISDFERYNISAPVAPQTGDKKLFLGVYKDGSNYLANYLIVYSRAYDDALKALLAKSKDGMVALS